ncbi:Ras-like GTP-binding protein RYL2 [Penicillium taxi]|uniref:Ras-like GTP-binding protein RYL2 n=1 Tax=Penicillium taxi TaxID=168475 RepID=UPI0025454600|nr:Ras-like GTP-binding protein RYL2 [Penicillium taxi]KAJ5885441.1 Ras-like GTP-binding protein RYL2 [Penicillium taxi]
MNPTKSLEFKLVVMGSAGVGKTSLVQRYVRNTFSPATTTSTVGASFVTKRVFDNASDTLIRLQIWDTAGQERFRSISRLYYRGAHACVLCYDITDENSFNEMTGWLRELRRNIDGSEGDADPLIIHVVGTKSDIVTLDPASRRVPFERTIAYVAEQLDPNRAGTPPASAMMEVSNSSRENTRGSASTSVASISGFGSSSGFFGQPPGSAGGHSNGSALLSPDSKRSSAFWGQEIGWDCCHEISAKDGEGIDEVFRVITRKLVEQRNRRDAELALSAAASPIREGIEGFPPMDGTGSFRLGHGDKRRSWLGLTSPGPGLGVEMEETELMQAARQRGRCC